MTLTPAHYAAASLLIANAIGECDFTARQRIILEVIRRRSYEENRAEAFIPKLDFFGAAGISRGNASEIINYLKKCQVIEERPLQYYSFKTPVTKWLVPGRLQMAMVMEQLALLPEPPDLHDALRETFIETALYILPTRGADCSLPSNRSEPAGSLPAVTMGDRSRESVGTEAHGSGRMPGSPVVRPGEANPSPALIATGSQIGNLEPGSQSGNLSGSQIGNPGGHPRKQPLPTRSAVEVPKSGTSSAIKRLVVERSAVQSSVPAELRKASVKRPLSPTERELRNELFALFDAETLKHWGGCWTNCIKRNAELVRRVMATYEADYREGVEIPNPGGYMWDLYCRWK